MAALYETLASCSVGGVTVNKLKSRRTGLVVCLAQADGPLVNGYICLATEAHDHDGLPHTLEHLIFMGSEKYPYKGVLDLLANRCLAQGTNAWTDVDHTCYTVTTAGSEGFLNLLPIYLDHILYPTLTDAAYQTEVHHINGKGDNAGVVYCEMQAIENTSSERTNYNMLQLLYPEDCGYRSETGGRLENLRTSTSNEKVISYHNSYYRPDNMALIVVGQVDPDLLFESLQPFEDKIISKGSLPAMQRPWQSPIPSLSQHHLKEVLFPTSEEEDGMVRIAWHGPNATDRYQFTAMEILMEYLADTPVAPLQRELVEVEDDPFCSDVELIELENAVTVFGVTMEGVPVEKLDAVEEKVMSVLTALGEGDEKIDMTRMKNILNQRIIKVLNLVEETPHYFFAFSVIGDFLFGKTPNDFGMYLDQVPRYRELLGEPDDYWRALIGQYLIAGSRVTVIGRPSAALADEMAKEEETRLSDQCKRLGEQGLKEKEEELQKAMSANEVPPPDDLVTSLPVPSTDSIHFHPLTISASEQLLFYMQLCNVNSKFIELTAVLDTTSLSQSMLQFVPLITELMFESPVLRNGVLVPYESVVSQLEADTVSVSASVGVKGGRFSPGLFPQSVVVSVKVEAAKYTDGVRHLKEALYQLQFTAERLGVVINKILNDVNRMKREGPSIVETISHLLNFSQECNLNIFNMLCQPKFLSSLVEKLQSANETTALLSEIAAARQALTVPSSLRIFLAGHIDSFSKSELFDPWVDFTSSSSPDQRSLSPFPHSWRFLQEKRGRAVIAGVSGIESNYLIQTVPCIKEYNHSDLAAIMVFSECLCALEGPMWRQIRGMGLAYHYHMSCKPADGLLSFRLFRSSQLAQAYVVAKEIVESRASGKCPVTSADLEGAKSGVIYQLIAREKTVSAAAKQAMYSHFRDTPLEYNRKLLKAVSTVTLEDIQRVGTEYFSRLFDSSQAVCAVCCNPSKLDEISTCLQTSGLQVEVVDDVDKLSQ